MSQESSSIPFASRRKTFLKALGNGIALFPASNKLIRNNDVTHPHRQDSNFFYLTGFEEASSLALFSPQSAAPFQMFVLPKDKTKELWEGVIAGPEIARKKYGADLAHPSNDVALFDRIFVEELAKADALYYRVGESAQRDQHIFRLLHRATRKLGRTGRPYWPIKDPNELLGEMRLFKTSEEIARLRKAAEISAKAHTSLMKSTQPGMHEYELEAQLYQEFRSGGAKRLGYDSIVASGANACVLHYTENERQIKSDDLVLVDAGAEYDYYTADITRTFPAGKEFTAPQREIYDAVLKAQLACVELARPGKTLRGLQECAIEILTEELLSLGILKGQKKQLMSSKAHQEYFPHGIGHWLGMDVHDIGKYYASDYEDPRPFEPGMVFTIEPGLYIQKYSSAPEKYKGIGVRIEDDVVITKNGCDVLTKDVPKATEEIEALRN